MTFCSLVTWDAKPMSNTVGATIICEIWLRWWRRGLSMLNQDRPRHVCYEKTDKVWREFRLGKNTFIFHLGSSWHVIMKVPPQAVYRWRIQIVVKQRWYCVKCWMESFQLLLLRVFRRGKGAGPEIAVRCFTSLRKSECCKFRETRHRRSLVAAEQFSHKVWSSGERTAVLLKWCVISILSGRFSFVSL